MTGAEIELTALFAAAAFLYASVGHAGASGYLAAMAVVGMAAAVMKPTALLLNLVVATIALVQFVRVGAFSWRLFWPCALGALPFAILGGATPTSAHIYRLLVAVVLAAAAVRLLEIGRRPDDQPLPIRPMPVVTGIALGALIGFFAGLTGTGGGIFLSPVLVLAHWSEARKTGGVAAAFILVNSIGGLIGHHPDLHSLPAALPWWMATVAVAGLVGAWVGSRRASPLAFRRLLAVVLLIAAAKLAFF